MNDDYGYYYDMDGKPISSTAASALLRKIKDRRVARDTVNGLDVSTVLLVMNHQFMDNAPPLIFETMIFGLGEDEEYQVRYSTKKKALAGHQVAIEYAKQRTKVKQGAGE